MAPKMNALTMKKLLGGFFVLVSLALLVAGGAAVVAMVRALTVQSTLPAIESAFGSLVIAIILLALARQSFKAGMARLKDQGPET